MGHEPVVKLLLTQGANPLMTCDNKKPSDGAQTGSIRQLLLDAEKETHKKVDLPVLATWLTKLNSQHDTKKMQQAIKCLQEAIETGKVSPTLDTYREVLGADKELQLILDRWFPESLLTRAGKIWSGFFSTSSAPPAPAVASVDVAAVESTHARDTTSNSASDGSSPMKSNRTP